MVCLFWLVQVVLLCSHHIFAGRNIKVCGTGSYAGRSFALRCDDGLVLNIERANYGVEESGKIIHRHFML